MHRCRIPFLFYLILLFAALSAKAQIASNPFSEFGIGDLQGGGSAQNQGMGGIGISNPHGAYINNLNPAMLTFNRYTLFQGGMQIEKTKLSDGQNAQKFKNGNLNYLIVALPIKPNLWTTSVGLTPYSNVNYNLSYQRPIVGSNNDLATYQYSGKGGLNQFYLSNGVRLNKYVSIGLKMTYVFGSVITQNPASFPGATANTSIYGRDSFHGLNFTGGIHLHKDSLFGRNYRINLGAVYSTGSSIHAQHVSRIQTTLTNGTIIDSLTYSNLSGTLKIPQNFGVGISFGKIDRWTVGYDFTYLDYRSFDYRTSDQTVQYLGTPTAGYRSGIGLELAPNPEDLANYLSRVIYRAGFSVEKSPMLVNNRPLIDVGGSFGFSLPVSRFSAIDVGVKIGRRGTVAQNALQENYVRVFFGITFLDQWFIKRKFD